MGKQETLIKVRLNQIAERLHDIGRTWSGHTKEQNAERVANARRALAELEKRL